MKVIVLCVIMTLALGSISLEAKGPNPSDTSFPSNPVKGQFHYDLVTHSVFTFNGKGWQKQSLNDEYEEAFTNPVLLAGGNSQDIATDIAVDEDGNIYVVGYFKENATFGTETLEPSSYINTFIWKLNSEGVHQWVVSPKGATFEDVARPTGIDIDNNGNLYVIGYFLATVTFGTETRSLKYLPPGMFDWDFYVWKLNSDGEHIWVKTEGGRGFDTPRDIQIDSQNNLYIAGSFKSSELPLGNTVLESSGDGDAFVWKLSSEGEPIWAVRGGGRSEDFLGSDNASHIVIDEPNNGVYITGRSNAKSTVFAGVEVTFPTIATAYVWKLNTDGEHQWIKGHEALDGGISSGLAIACDKEGNVYSSGFLIGDNRIGDIELSGEGFENSYIYLWKLNSQGEHQWVISGGGVGPSNPRDMVIDSKGFIYLAGFASGGQTGTSNFLGHTFMHENTAFVWKLNENGEHIWIELAKGHGAISNGIALDKNDNIFVVGEIQFRTVFGGVSVIPTAFEEPGDKDIFVWNLAEITTSQSDLNFNSMSLDFGLLEIGESKEITLTIENTGTAAAEIESIEIVSFPEVGHFSTTSIDGLLLTKSSEDITVNFNPGSLGTKEAVLRIKTSDVESPYEINLVGQAAAVTSLEPARKSGVRMFPNPAGSVLNLSFNGGAIIPEKILITTINGKELLTFDKVNMKGSDGTYTFPIEELSTGAYLVYGISKGKKTLIDKLVVH